MLLQPMSSPQMTRMLGLPAVASADAGFLPAPPEFAVGESGAAHVVPTPVSNATHTMTAVLDTYSHLQRLVATIPLLLVTREFDGCAPKRRSRRLTCQAAIRLWLLSRDTLWL